MSMRVKVEAWTVMVEHKELLFFDGKDSWGTCEVDRLPNFSISCVLVRNKGMVT